MRIRRPHEVNYAALRTRQRVPLQSFVLVRTSMFKERGGGGRDISPRGNPEICVCDAQSTKEKRVHARERLHSDFDGPDIIVAQKTN